MIVSVCFTNFGPYHLARLRALAALLEKSGDELIAYEVAGGEEKYAWERRQREEPFEWVTLFPDRVLESLSPSECAGAMVEALDRDQPDALGIVGYSRPESMAAARWAKKHDATSVLMSESQAIDRPRVWWKERIKRHRLRFFDSALVGGNEHRNYLIELGMPADRIALGYNAVDNDFFTSRAEYWRGLPQGAEGLPTAPYFLSVCRFVPEKNLIRLIEAFARYRESLTHQAGWDLVLCGDGSQKEEINEAIAASGQASAIHCPGFLQADSVARWYSRASAFVLPSVSEPWGLVANEAACAGLPLLISSRAGCAETLVPEPMGTTGSRFDPLNLAEIIDRLRWLSQLPDSERDAMGRRAAEVVGRWGPKRFATGTIEAIEIAGRIGSGKALVSTHS